MPPQLAIGFLKVHHTKLQSVKRTILEFCFACRPTITVSLDIRQQLEPRHIMRTLVLRFLNNEDATTAIEYGLIAAGISVAIIAAVNSVGVQLNTVLYQKITTALAQ